MAKNQHEKADVLIGADGFRSAIRGQMHPDIQPEYSGYVVWRALAEESAIPADVHGIPMQPVFEPLGYTEADFPHSADACREVLSLPIHQHLTTAEVERIVDAIVAHYR